MARRRPVYRLSGSFDHNSRESHAEACVAAVAGFALDAGVERLMIDNPALNGFFSFSHRVCVTGNGLHGLFDHRHRGFHDGAEVSLGTGLGLLRAMVLRHGAWCRLSGGGGFFLHVGDEGEIYVGGAPVDTAVAAERARALGLVVADVESSPYAPELDETAVARPADDAFWAEVGEGAAERGGVLLEEQYVRNGYRWYALASAGDVPAVRAKLTPRARLAVWPDLSADTDAVRAAIERRERVALLVEEPQLADAFPAKIVERRTEVRKGRAALIPVEPADRRPLLAAEVPDGDGVLRTRWRVQPTRAEQLRTLLGSLRDGDRVRGVVATGLHDVGVYVDLDVDVRLGPGLDGDIGRHVGFLRLPEMSWSRSDSADDVAPVGREIEAEVLSVEFGWEQVNLSMKALHPDPWRLFAATGPIGRTFTGVVSMVVPFGVFVDLPNSVGAELSGLVHADDLAELPGLPVVVGDELAVFLEELDLERRRILLRPVPEADSAKLPG
ncbi:S1 RNA-binding domain-containing protein [Kitasatospora aureofaciens]|uniref:S1 RNA-binding domain-containing protein n=1 Tax=Kitasatospora aureofaciens TaxID=1894 RepID=UPI001C4961F6|nr:S1 RNA-binding domain-containing protein [Kitasatospora aureofaciens]MBV6700672.1 S1 RNA-binding domain-containing protein [Kitasatospora aureofaciens]